MERPALKREVVKYIVSHYGLKLARACRLMKQVRSTQYLHSTKDPKRRAWFAKSLAFRLWSVLSGLQKQSKILETSFALGKGLTNCRAPTDCLQHLISCFSKRFLSVFLKPCFNEKQMAESPQYEFQIDQNLRITRKIVNLVSAT